MSWRGQGGRRAKGRRGDQDPELDNTAWLAELEREAAQADDDEDDWASTLRGRRSPATPPPEPVASAPDPGWPPVDPEPADHRFLGMEPSGSESGSWSPDPPPQDPPASPPADPDWSWRPPASDAFAEPGPEAFGDPRHGTEPGADWSSQPPSQADAGWSGSRAEPVDPGWQPGGADTPTGAWSPADPPVHDPGYPNGQAPAYPATSEPGYPAEEPGYPVGREPDYPALFGELYRRSAAQQDPIWEAPPPIEPLPEAGQPQAPPGAWPFEETTQSWEPSDRSFIWPSDELPSAPAEWDRPSSTPWLDDPPPSPPAPPPPAPPLDQTAAWPALYPDPDPAARPSPRPARSAGGNGVAPPPAPLGPPPAAPAAPPPVDWAAAIPTDVPAARRAADPAAATRMWPDQAADAEPGVPLGGRAAARTSRSWAPADTEPATGTAGSRVERRQAPVEEPGELRRKGPAPARRKRPAGERQARAWPRIVAIVAWIVLVMVVCWFYVFPWLERVLPESF